MANDTKPTTRDRKIFKDHMGVWTVEWEKPEPKRPCDRLYPTCTPEEK
jgi:hypothetical protein